jgi:hypothetical protein
MIVNLVLTLLLGAVRADESANPYLVRAKSLFASQRFIEARVQLEIALEVPAMDSSQRLEALDLLGRCQIAEGKRALAEDSFARLLTLDPHWELDRGASPKVLGVFDAAKSRLFALDFVALSPLLAPPMQPRAAVVDPWKRVARVWLMSKANGEKSWHEQELPLIEHVAAFDFGPAPLAERWYLEARDTTGAPVARLGSPDQPFILAVHSSVPEEAVVARAATPAPPSTSATRAKRTGAWVVAAVALAAGVGGLVLQVQSSRAATEARAEEWADSARTRQASATTQAGWAIGLFSTAGVAAATSTVLFVW